MTKISSSKKKLREHYLRTRNNLSKSLVLKKSALITEKVLVSREFSNASVIHTYVSIERNHEVDTSSLITEALKRNKRVVVPKVIGQGELDHIEINSLEELKENKWGVPEPEKKKKIRVNKLDLVIVPMVAGDQKKNRLGYGKGYYDRFLVNCPAVKIGLLFDCQLHNDKLPVETFDIPLDILITETRRIE